VKKIFKIDSLRGITDVEFIQLMNEKQLKEIAEDFDISPSQVSLEISKRNLFEVKKENKSRKIKFNPKRKQFIIKEEELHCKGAWINSPERISFVNAGLIKNKSIKYINYSK